MHVSAFFLLDTLWLLSTEHAVSLCLRLCLCLYPSLYQVC
jgi:hypothetical protein